MKCTGFGSMEQLAFAADVTKPINASAVAEVGRAGRHGLQVVVNLVIVSQWRGDEALYCRVITGRYLSSNGLTPMDGSNTARVRNQQAHTVVVRWLERQGFTVREALLAMPRSYKLLEGAAGFLAFDKERGFFLEETK